MLIIIITRNAQAKIQKFSCQVDSLERGLDAVSLIAGKGHQLLEALLIDEDTTTPLPLEVFDGQSFTKPIQKLEREWQLILREKFNREMTGNQRVADLIDRRIKHHRTIILRLERAVSFAQQQLQRVQNSRFRERYSVPILSQLQRVLERYEHNLAREQESLQRLLNQVKLR